MSSRAACLCVAAAILATAPARARAESEPRPLKASSYVPPPPPAPGGATRHAARSPTFATVFECASIGYSPSSLTAEGKSPEEPGRRMDVLFMLDSTASMVGALDDVKRAIRAIESALAGCRAPLIDLRVGILTYRDKGDSYLTKHIPLSRNFEAANKFLDRIDANEGGDFPEFVARAMHVAVSTFNWDLHPGTLRTIVLFGDAPTHTDYADGFSLEAEADVARSRHITIHTVLVGHDVDARAQWKALSAATGGVALESAGPFFFGLPPTGAPPPRLRAPRVAQRARTS